MIRMIQRHAGIHVSAIFLCLWTCSITFAEETVGLSTGLSKLDLTDLKRHVTTLASDSLEGREAGSRGGKAALAYLRSELNASQSTERPLQIQTQEFGREYQNLLALLPGSDEALRNEVIVIGAHYDHVGYGRANNSAGPIGYIHNGADDNASGTSIVLELIQAFASLEPRPCRTILFAFWDAEEIGLLGSKHWVDHPTQPIKNVRLAMNLDMLGRLRDGRLVTIGWRSAPGLREALATHNVTNTLKLAFQPKVLADSDHYNFYASRIPIIHFDTDKHEDYHRPSDDPEKLNWDGLLQVTQFAYRVILDLASRTDMPQFRPAVFSESAPNWMMPHNNTPAPSRIGVGWDTELAKKKIVKVAHVAADSPASQAGIKPGDQFVKLGPWENGTLEDLKTVLQIAKNPVPITVVRDGKPAQMNANLWGQPVRLGASWNEDVTLPNCVVMTQVVAESPADRAGLAAGDVIVEYAGKPIVSSEDLRQRVMTDAGPFQFRIERHGRLQNISVELFDSFPSPTVPDAK